MAYTAPSTVTAGQTYTATAHNVIVNDIIDHESRILNTGLTFIKTTAISAASSTVCTSCFTTTYTNYKVKVALTAASADGYVAIRFANGSTPDTATNYRWFYEERWFGDTGTNADGNSSNTAGLTDRLLCGYMYSTGSPASYFDFEVFSPKATAQTGVRFESLTMGTANNPYTYQGGGGFKATTSFDGIAVISHGASPATLTGSITVYGYNG